MDFCFIAIVVQRCKTRTKYKQKRTKYTWMYLCYDGANHLWSGYPRRTRERIENTQRDSNYYYPIRIRGDKSATLVDFSHLMRHAWVMFLFFNVPVNVSFWFSIISLSLINYDSRNIQFALFVGVDISLRIYFDDIPINPIWRIIYLARPLCHVRHQQNASSTSTSSTSTECFPLPCYKSFQCLYLYWTTDNFTCRVKTAALSEPIFLVARETSKTSTRSYILFSCKLLLVCQFIS